MFESTIIVTNFIAQRVIQLWSWKRPQRILAQLLHFKNEQSKVPNICSDLPKVTWFSES